MAAVTERDILKFELRWGLAVAGVVALIFAAIVWAAVAMGINPPSNGAVIDPATLHLSGEFAEANLGVKVESDGAIVARVVTAQFQFTPDCIMVPAGKPEPVRLITVIPGCPDVGEAVGERVTGVWPLSTSWVPALDCWHKCVNSRGDAARDTRDAGEKYRISRRIVSTSISSTAMGVQHFLGNIDILLENMVVLPRTGP